MARESNIVKIVGKENFQRLRSLKCLIVGAGGIGSELLKDCILMGFGEIHIVDLDTIDLSNLNRQFLFRHRDIKQPKSTTAVKAVQHFNNSKLVPYQGNIMDTVQFPLSWFDQFDIIFNGLDNLAARRYVNKIAQFISKPLLESGTSGFDGYIQPIIPGETECFDCTKKETPKTFPVCTIRSTPSQPVHCIVWAKNFLFNQLFNEETSSADETSTDWGTENKEEIDRIRQETNELHELRQIILSKGEERIKDILTKLFVKDIEKLLRIDNLWKTRTKPTLLDQSLIDDASQAVTNETQSLSSMWDIKEQIIQFFAITKKLMQRVHNGETNIEFDKDDEDTLLFVATAANIRSHIFNIPMKTVFDIKQIAGNIIPAIATTNAIIAGLSTLTALRVLNLLPYEPTKRSTDLNMAFTAKASNLSKDRYITNPRLAPPNPSCPVGGKVCRGVIKITQKGLNEIRLSKLVKLIRQKYQYPEEISVIDASNQRLLADFDFDDLIERSLSQVNLHDGSVILFSDEEGTAEAIYRKSLELYIEVIDGSLKDEIQLPDVEVPTVAVPVQNTAHTDHVEEKQGKSVNNENVIELDFDEKSETGAVKRPAPEEAPENALKRARKDKEYVDGLIELD
ncbi:hypothetical protein HG537_0A04870 [Torulaspora globosa]|uniref:Ubiquitin-activating enzyme E1-like n=1 Tax=Torulaspora globosa TaxID=48254 RepID=A0A7H9HLN3_9SACH|nr:hypothetical protein HG537_0A04870 [Torulaspora sp. CBS 2947]